MRPYLISFLVCTLILFTNILIAQNKQDYYVVVRPGYSLEPTQTTTNPDQTLNLQFIDNDLENFFSNIPVYYFAKEFPTAQSTYLQRVYRVILNNGTHLGNIFNLEEVEYVELIIPDGPLYLPNDYTNLEGNPLSQLDLIKAPLAWNITQGDPGVLAAIADHGYIDVLHEDLENQIFYYSGEGATGSHGTKVAGMLSAQTNNNLGIAAIGFNSKLAVLSDNSLYSNEILDLVSITGVKVINYSAGNCTYSPVGAAFWEEIWEVKGVVVVCAAGNAVNNGGDCTGDPNQYYYPASYDHAISVSAVGHLFPLGTNDPELGITNWKDVHERVIGDPTSTAQHNDKVDICAPGYYLTTTWNNDEYGVSGATSPGTSLSAPMVAGVVALMFAVNPNLTPDQVRDILMDTADDIYLIPENAPYIGLLGAGRVNAYRAVLQAQCLNNPTSGLNLMTRNSDLDTGTEPDLETEFVWQSTDIWVRNQDDGRNIQEHQNPEYDANDPNFVYVRVTNNSCETSSGNDQLKLYWAKANTSLSWPQHWNGTLFIEDPITDEDILMGDEIATLNIPILEPGEEAILEFEWDVPNPDDYLNINPNPWHFCLLSRIISTDDPMTFPEGSGITQNVTNNNNIAWKNTTVVDIVPGTPSWIGGVVAVGNPFAIAKAYKLELKKQSNETGAAIYDEAEVSFEMDELLYNAWVRGGKQGSNFDSTRVAKKKIVRGNNVVLDNILFEPHELGTLYLSFNFLTEELTDKQEYLYHVIQKDATTNEILGGETYEVRKKPKDTFTADAGDDTEIDKHESVTISAAQINGAAVYNWYDPQGNLVHTGTDLTVSPNVTITYKLELISDSDGYKDYDEVEVAVNPYKFENLIPNPATTQVTVNYIADEAASAYLMVASTVTGTSNNYILDVQESSINLDITLYPSGLYSIALMCDGEIVDSKNLAKQ